MLENGVRKLVTIRTIKSLEPILGADRIEVASVDGWKVVVKKDQFSVGEKVAYFEVDSLLPTTREEFSFLSGNNDLHRLRTVKLRGQISQGFICKLPEDKNTWNDLDAYFGVTKYELPEDVTMRGDIKGVFPSFIPKTDLERVQNIGEDFKGVFEVTQKLDGTSLTVFRYENEFNVCSRNNMKKESDSCVYWKTVKESGIVDKLPDGYALQGELMGPKIQNNRMQLKSHRLFVFNVFHIPTGKYLDPEERMKFMKDTNLSHLHIPIVSLTHSTLTYSLEDLLELANKVASENIGCEGLSFKNKDIYFKVISNNYLLKHGE